MANVDYDDRWGEMQFELAKERGEKLLTELGPEAYNLQYATFEEWMSRGRMVKKGSHHVHRNADGVCMFSVEQTENRMLSRAGRTLGTTNEQLKEQQVRKMLEGGAKQATPACAYEDPSAMRDAKALERKLVNEVVKRPKTKKAPRFWATEIAPVPTPGTLPTLWGA